jgi:hypothetical protein
MSSIIQKPYLFIVEKLGNIISFYFEIRILPCDAAITRQDTQNPEYVERHKKKA